jgi:hypothetical protein
MKSYIVNTFLALFLSFIFLKTDATLQCMADNMGTGPYDKPCIFPFRYLNETITECTSLYVAANVTGSWCATSVDTNGTFVTDQWGICNCTEILPACGKHWKDIPKESVEVFSLAPKIDCNWDVRYSESYLSGLRNPTMVLYFQNITLEIRDDATISSVNPDNSTQLLLSTKQELINPATAHLGVWTSNPNVNIHLKSDLGGENKGFVLNFFIGFCSDFDGDMDLPSFDLLFNPQNIFLISDNNNPITGSNTTYRPHSDCTWSIPNNPQNKEMLTLNFYRFNISSGDKVNVLVKSTRLNLYIFDSATPPVPIYTDEEGLFVNFQSDDKDEGFGFDANILRGLFS